MKSTKVQNPQRNKCSVVVETNCLVAEYCIPYRIRLRTIITHAHRAPLIDGLGHATWSATLANIYGLNLVEVSQWSLCILYMLFRLFSRHISQTQSFQQNHYINFLALVALKLLVLLISRIVACSARIVTDKHTDRQTDRTTTVTLAAHAR